MSKRPVLLIVIALNLLVLVALAFAYPQLMVSPGPLVQGHADLSTDCFACHVPLRGASPALCIGCHAVAEIGLKTTAGAPIVARATKAAFHQDLIEQDCMACHSDHQGPKLSKRSRKPFSHALLNQPVQQRCAFCHTAPKDTMHRDLKVECSQCHQTTAWTPATFDHDKFFVLDRDHNATCDTCHKNSDYSQYTCYGCHEHSQANVRAEHVEEGIRDFENCVECHRNPGVEPEKASRSGQGGKPGKGDRD